MTERYATNARWPEANQWTWHRQEQQTRKRFEASETEVKLVRAKDDQKASRKLARQLKDDLFRSIIERDLEACTSMTRSTLLLEAHTPYGATPLILAAAVGDLAIVALLLELGASVTAQDKVGASPLITAAFKGHTEVVQALLSSKQGGNVGRAYLLRQCTKRGETAAMAAAKMGHLDTLKVLVDAGSDAMAADRDGADALALAASLDRVAVVQYLVSECHVSADRMDDHSRTPLMRAAAGGAWQAVQLLLSLDPPVEVQAVDERGLTAMHHAISGGSVKVVEILSAAGLSLDERDIGGGSRLLSLACGAGHVDVVVWLLKHDVGVARLMDDGGNNPMFEAARHERYAVIDLLLAAGARIDVRDEREHTPLAWAAAHGKTELARHLVKRGASLLVVDTHGHVPRQLAQLGHHAATAQLLSELAGGQFIVADDAISTVTQL